MSPALLVAAVLALAGTPAADPHGPLVVSANHHFLQYQDGTPFFWLGDTAWLLLSKLDRAETEQYLDDRQRKGFNVLQVMVLHGAGELIRVGEQTAAGIPALVNEN